MYIYPYLAQVLDKHQQKACKYQSIALTLNYTTPQNFIYISTKEKPSKR